MKKKITWILILAVAFTLFMPAGQLPKVKAAEEFQEEITGQLKPFGKVIGTEGIASYARSAASYKNCYGEQLDEEAKGLYDAMVKQYVTAKGIGDVTYTFNTPFRLDSAKEFEQVKEDDNYQMMMEEIGEIAQSAGDAFEYDHPEVFWLYQVSYNVKISGQRKPTGCSVKIDSITIRPGELYSGASGKIAAYEEGVQRAMEEIKNNCVNINDRYELIKSIHTYVCEKASYYKGTTTKKIYTTEPLLLGNGQVVCEGYAKTIKVLCDRFEIPCACVSGVVYPGTSRADGHMWNAVKMNNGKWYLIDATWNDQPQGIQDTYFLAGKNSKGFEGTYIKDERLERADFSGTGAKVFVYPILNNSKYVYTKEDSYTPYTRTAKATAVYTKKGTKKVKLELCAAAKQKVNQYDTVKGSTGNGKYSYYILYNRKASKCKIVKARQSDFKVVKVSKALSLGEGIDMTYNADKKRLVVLNGQKASKRLYVVRPDTLKIESSETVNIPSTIKGAKKTDLKAINGFSGIAYNASKKQYVLHLKNSSNVLLLNKNRKPVKYVTLSKKNPYKDQGIEVAANYILIGQSPKKKSQVYNIISVYDWSGQYVGMLRVKKGEELKSVYKSGSSYYAAFYKIYYKKKKLMREDYVYKLSKMQIIP
ncbi:MAG: transglutaminase domain-containing protein [Lachnospiraceae bacterium]|nr:transglutaminase domain-containing protein [Lachnospiraceae bacterium]